jgi:hypothetical protein
MLRGPEDGGSEFLRNVSNFPTDYKDDKSLKTALSSRATDSGRGRLTGHLTDEEKLRNAYEILAKNSDGKSLFGRENSRRDDNIK